MPIRSFSDGTTIGTSPKTAPFSGILAGDFRSTLTERLRRPFYQCFRENKRRFLNLIIRAKHWPTIDVNDFLLVDPNITPTGCSIRTVQSGNVSGTHRSRLDDLRMADLSSQSMRVDHKKDSKLEVLEKLFGASSLYWPSNPSQRPSRSGVFRGSTEGNNPVAQLEFLVLCQLERLILLKNSIVNREPRAERNRFVRLRDIQSTRLGFGRRRLRQQTTNDSHAVAVA